MQLENLVRPIEKPSSFFETLEFLKTRIKRIIYNQLNFLAPKCQIEYNPKEEVYHFTNFYKNPAYPNQGSCGELEAALFEEMTKKRQTTYSHFGTILRAYGQDGGRNGVVGFCGEGDNHCFILVSSKKDLIDKNTNYYGTTNHLAFQKLIENCFVVDPSFGRIISLKESSYTVDGCSGENVKIERTKNLILGKHCSVPLFLSKNGENLWGLWNGGNEYGLCLTKKNKCGDFSSYSVGFANLKGILVKEIFGSVVSPTSSKSKEWTKLKAQEESVIRMLDKIRTKINHQKVIN